jgi:ribosomal protein S18 acetylase RimI-like enzyme
MFNIKSIEDEKELAMLREFMLSQAQYYPEYGLWLDSKCLPRVESGEYQNLVVIADGRVIGDAIHRSLGDSRVEVKNFRIDPHYTRRDLGNFLMTQVGYLNPGKALVLDVTTGNFEGVEFFIKTGFRIKGKAQLYKPGQDEFLMEKPPIRLAA